VHWKGRIKGKEDKQAVWEGWVDKDIRKEDGAVQAGKN